VEPAGEVKMTNYAVAAMTPTRVSNRTPAKRTSDPPATVAAMARSSSRVTDEATAKRERGST
jgi:hypothetical protein